MPTEGLLFSDLAMWPEITTNQQPGKWPIGALITDSRRFQSDALALFVAIKGKVHNGHNHLLALYEGGIRHFLVEELPDYVPSDAYFYQCPNTLRALQKLAAFHRRQFQYPVVGITGSNGKTVVKEWSFQLLHRHFKISRSPRSYNSQLGLPLSVWGMAPSHDLALIEAGISEPGEMDYLEAVLNPDVGIFTTLGSAHQENFESFEQKAAEKLRLFRQTRLLIYCRDHALIHQSILQYHKGETFCWSLFDAEAPLFVKQQENVPGGLKLELEYQKESFHGFLPFSDRASLENALHAFSLGLCLGVEARILVAEMANLQAVNMRLELKPARKNALLINDSYNSDLESLRIALDFQEQQGRGRHLVLVLSDMEQTGLAPEVWIQEVAKLCNNRPLEALVCVGPLLNQYALRYFKKAECFENTEALLAKYRSMPWQNSMVLLKGARRFSFERLEAAWEEKRHQTVLEINLNALNANLQKTRAGLPKQVKIMAVIKAYGYGAGSAEIAALLQYQKVDYLAVAYADEGVALRQAGITLPIMVMHPEPEALDVLIEYKLEPEIYAFYILEKFVSRLLALYNKSEAFPIHIKLETGMHRLGFESHELQALAQYVKAEPLLRVASVFSHLAAADEPHQQTKTQAQIEQFDALSGQFTESLRQVGPPLRHLLNSAGIQHYGHAAYDMVRLGIGLYGLSDRGEPVSRLLTRISQIKHLEAGDALGYGFSFVASRPTKTATLAIGYADGLRRELGNGKGHVNINGQWAPIVGRVCMDMCMVDVSHIDCKEGDEAEIFGRYTSVQQLADTLHTIPYEVLTGISQRVKRIYIQE